MYAWHNVESPPKDGACLKSEARRLMLKAVMALRWLPVLSKVGTEPMGQRLNPSVQWQDGAE
jgi:hypothetical protein